MKVGFVGLGIMGHSMAMNLIKNGYELTVYNRTKSKADALIKAGAKWADTPAQAAKDADIFFTMLGDPIAVRETALGENGFLTSLKKNSLWVDCTTVNPSFSKEMNDKAKEKGIRFMDAPVTGTKTPAQKGELSFYVGGDEGDLKEVEPLLKVMGKAINYMGKAGMGSSIKIIFNLMLGVNMAAFSEAFTLGQKLGIAKEKILDSMIGGISTPPFISYKRNKLETNTYETDFPLRWMLKDLQLDLKTAEEFKINLAVTNSASKVYSKAVNKGLGDLDFSAVYKYVSEQQ